MAKSTIKIAPKATTNKEAEVKPYEVMIMLQPELRESEVKKHLKETEEFFTSIKGKITNTDVWGRKDLSYKIKQFTEGIYIVYNLELPTSEISELNEYLRLEKDIIRHIIITLTNDYVYSKFDEETEEDEEDEEELPNKKAIKTKPAPTKEATPAKKIEAKEVAEPKDKGKEASEDELDAQRDKIIGGDDIENL